ncbi:hypothetical protein B296_00013249, partial [Ensete ventricosum]
CPSPLAPFVPSLPLHRRRLPLPTGSHPPKGQPPLLPTSQPLLAASGSPLRASYSRPPLRVPRYKRLCPRATLLHIGAVAASCCPYGLSPLAGVAGLPCGMALAAADRPLVGAN